MRFLGMASLVALGIVAASAGCGRSANTHEADCPGRSSLDEAVSNSSCDDSAAKPVRKGFGRAETGATAIEYALIAALISVFILTSVALMGNGLTSVYNVLDAAMVGVFSN